MALRLTESDGTLYTHALKFVPAKARDLSFVWYSE